MYYKPRKGIVKTAICGVQVLIPSREAFGSCSTIQRLPNFWAMTWEALSNGVPMERIAAIHCEVTKKPKEDVCANLERFCRDLCRKGFLVEVPEEEKPE